MLVRANLHNQLIQVVVELTVTGMSVVNSNYLRLDMLSVQRQARETAVSDENRVSKGGQGDVVSAEQWRVEESRSSSSSSSRRECSNPGPRDDAD